MFENSYTEKFLAKEINLLQKSDWIFTGFAKTSQFLD